MCLKTFDNRALDKTSPDLTISGRLVFSTNIWHNELRMIGVSFFPQNDFLANLNGPFCNNENNISVDRRTSSHRDQCCKTFLPFN